MLVFVFYLFFFLLYFSIFLSFLKDFLKFIFRERGKERERKGEKHLLVASHVPPNQEQTKNETGDLSFCGMMPNQLSHTGHGSLFPCLCSFFITKYFITHHKHVILSHNNITLKHTIWHFRWNVQIKTVNYYTHITITLPTTLKQALLLPDPVFYFFMWYKPTYIGNFLFK